jgi:hypothetical protein
MWIDAIGKGSPVGVLVAPYALVLALSDPVVPGADGGEFVVEFAWFTTDVVRACAI